MTFIPTRNGVAAAAEDNSTTAASAAAQSTAEKVRGWKERFFQSNSRDRVPISGTLELTSRCNLKCVHCYIGSQEEARKHRDKELDTEQVKGLVDQMVKAGCLYLLITGGDPMVRKDFPEIYEYARRQGLLVTVFCDGILVNDRIIELFKKFAPRQVEVSLYGATAETYEKITRVQGSYPRAMAGIRRLLENGINTAIKTVHMTWNHHELDDMRAIAAELGIPFRHDAGIFPCLPNSDKEPLKLRVTPEQAVAGELSDPAMLERWKKYYESRKDLKVKEDSLYACGAGATSFYMDPFGNMSPCLMTTHLRWNVVERGFDNLWNGEVKKMRESKPSEDYGCNSCDKRMACSSCPAFNYLENGDESAKSEYICETTQLRFQVITADDPSAALFPIVRTAGEQSAAQGCGSGCGCH